jgi:hypothetical protein
MRKTLVTAFAVGIVVARFAGCGSSGDTTVIKTTPAQPTQATQTVTTTTPNQASTSQGTAPGAPSSGTPPKVTGLTLPTAKKQLSAAGFTADVSNTDTAFGIIVPENYTVCKQSAPRGNIVPILAQKYGC